MDIRFTVCKSVSEDGSCEVIMLRDGSRHTRTMSADDARWLSLALEAGKKLAKDEILNWISK